MLTRRRLIATSAAAFGSAATGLVPRALAQVVDKRVSIIVEFPPGGGTDVIARLLAAGLRGRYASTVIVENKPGAGGRLGVNYVKEAKPDGSVMLFTPDFPMTVYPHSYRSLKYDPLRDFTPVATVAKSVLTYHIGPAVPANVKTLADFVHWCKDNPKKAEYATTGAGGTPHFVGLMFAKAAGLNMIPVHYRGGAPALQDVLGGQIPAGVNPISETLPYAKSGALRVLAVTGARRSSFLPDVPTMVESGYDVVVEAWLGVFLPAKAPAAIVSALSADLRNLVKSPAMVASLTKLGNEPDFEPPAQFTATIKADIQRWGPVVKASGFVAD